ncbi:MAG: hypothetical protein JWQ35_1229 [Bacteriovoracaceae bacterium]|nr:hypothetical protein [Bacteriovoracaceae bacterium]
MRNKYWRLKIFFLIFFCCASVFANATDDLLQAVWARKGQPDQGKIISNLLTSNEPIDWAKLTNIAYQIVQLDNPAYKEGSFLEALLLSRRFDGLTALLEAGVNPLSPLDLEYSEKDGSHKIRTRLFHRLVEQIIQPAVFTDAEMSQISKNLALSLKFKPNLEEALHQLPNRNSVIAAVVYMLFTNSQQPEEFQLKENQISALKSFLISIVKGKNRPANMAVPLLVETSANETESRDFNLLNIAVVNHMEDLIEALVEAGADSQLEATGQGSTTAFNSAILLQDRKSISLFLKAGANINRKGKDSLTRRPLHMIPIVYWKDKKAPALDEYTAWLMSLGLDPYLGNGDPNHNLAIEVMWRSRIESATQNPDPSKLIVWKVFFKWLTSAKFHDEYEKYSEIRKRNRETFPDFSNGDTSAYESALHPILKKVVNEEARCADKVVQLSRNN